jgi:tRNA dimethylallyltransferase
MPNIEVITGPTASGKTDRALLRWEENHDVEIVNADASLLYKGFDIGTAKPSKEIQDRIPHHIMDILNPDESFNAGDYAKLARSTICEIITSGKKPLVVGGTGLYIDALFFGIAPLEADKEKLEEQRERIENELIKFGFDTMLERLKDVDSELYKQIIRERNPRRLERAWTFYYATGTPLGEARKAKSESFEFEPRFTLLEVEREELRDRIAKRTDQMLASGWLDEVKEILASGVTSDMPAMNAIGYRELMDVLQNGKKLEEAREEIIIRTRQYAKRQETWMKRYKNNDYQT